MIFPAPAESNDNVRSSDKYDAELLAIRDRLEREAEREEAKRRAEARERYEASARITADRARAIGEREQAGVAARERESNLQQMIATTADSTLRALALVARATRDADVIDVVLALASERTNR